jgi:hypothetical protein
MTAETKTLYIFIDESGNFDFSPNGTKHFALTSITTTQPLKDREKFAALRYALLQKGMDQECFHATEDEQKVRDSMFARLAQLTDVQVDCVLVQKNKANPSLYLEVQNAHKGLSGIKFKHSGEKLYRIVSQTLLQYIFNRNATLQEADKIVVVLGKVFVNSKREYILKSLKQFLKQKTDKPFYIYFHRVEADINCQLADYCGWAVYVNAERNEKRPLQALGDKVKSCFDMFSRGTKTYY